MFVDTVATGISGRFSWGLEMVCWSGTADKSMQGQLDAAAD
jgi:hypothetical protein